MLWKIFLLTRPPPDGNFDHNSLLILKKFGDYFKYYYGIYKTLPKIDRFGIGKEIAEGGLAVYILLFRASKLNRQDFRKKKFILEANEIIDLLRFLVRTCFELKLIRQNQYLLLSKQLLEIGKMSGGLIKKL